MAGFFNDSSLQKSAPESLLPKCGACKLFKHCETPKMRPFGKGRKKLATIESSWKKFTLKLEIPDQ